MAANSEAMTNFRLNVLQIIEATDGLSISSLVVRMNKTRKRRRQTTVSRTFVSNLLHGHKDCSIPFAEEISQALGFKLQDLLDSPKADLAAAV